LSQIGWHVVSEGLVVNDIVFRGQAVALHGEKGDNVVGMIGRDALEGVVDFLIVDEAWLLIELS
jgi:hypothetical protein